MFHLLLGLSFRIFLLKMVQDIFTENGTPTSRGATRRARVTPTDPNERKALYGPDESRESRALLTETKVERNVSKAKVEPLLT